MIRHAQSTANVSAILAGRIDPTPLTSKGRTAARALTPIIAAFDPESSLVSPLLRCRETGNLAGVNDFSLDERLIEMDYGSWSGRPLKSLSRRREWNRIQKDPGNFTFPGGESFQGAAKRISDLTEELLDRDEERFLLISHGDICRILINDLLGRSLNAFQQILIEPASHSLLTVSSLSTRREEGSATLSYLNRLPVDYSKVRAAQRYKLGGE